MALDCDTIPLDRVHVNQRPGSCEERDGRLTRLRVSVVLLASTSKVLTVTLLMALYEDADGVSSVGLISQLIAIIDEALDKVR
jgi:hypothetical protein